MPYDTFESESGAVLNASWARDDVRFAPEPCSVETADEERLLDESLAGNLESFARLFDRYRSSLLGRCDGILRDRPRAEDIVQETFIHASERLHSFDRSRRRVWPWLVTLAERLCIDALRVQPRESFSADLRSSDEIGLPLDVPDPSVSLERVIANDERSRVVRAVMKMPPRQRRALLLYAVEGWTYADIASAERTSVGTVKSVIFRARATLRKAYESGRLATLFVPIRSLKRRLTRAADRMREAGYRLPAEALLAGGGNVLVAAVLTIAVAFSPAGGVASSAGSVAHQAPAPAEALAVSAPAHGPALPEGGAPGTAKAPAKQQAFSVGPVSAPLVGEILDPGNGATPERTTFTSIVVSPGYAKDHTMLAAGMIPCKRPPCYVLFVTRDGGASWDRLPATGFSGQTILLPPAYPADDRIFAMGPAGLQQSADGGATFTAASPASGGAAISPAFNAGDPRILIGSGAVVEYRADRGTTAPATFAAAPGPGATIAFSPAYPQQEVVVMGGIQPDVMGGLQQSAVYRCEKLVCAATPLPGQVGVPSIRLSPAFATDGVAYAFTDGALFASRDGARTFQLLGLPADGQGYLRDVAIGRGGVGGQAFAAFGARSRSVLGGLFRSADWGVSWSTVQVVAPGFDAGSLARIAVTSSGRLVVAGGARGIACSADGGRSWDARCRPDSG